MRDPYFELLHAHHQERIQHAAIMRLTTQSHTKTRPFGHVMCWLGRHFVAFGWRLQGRYATA